MNIAYIALGSNLGDREKNCKKAIETLQAIDYIDILKISSFYETTAVGTMNAPPYINAAIEINTILTPRELFKITIEIEKKLGRRSKSDWAPRTIDLDILLYNKDIISDEDLVIPHPLMHTRKFVLDPMCEIASMAKHPLFECSIAELSHELTDY